MLTLNIFPNIWKRALIVPLLKGNTSDAHAPISYLPISLISYTSKIYEFVLLNHLNDFVDSHDIIIAEQFGFRKRHSTQYQLWSV